MPGLQQITSPAESDENITLEDVKSHLRVTHSLDDSLIDDYRRAALRHVENRTDRTIDLTTYKFYLDKVYRTILLPKSPVHEVVSFTYMDENGDWTNFEDYVLDTVSEPARVYIPGTVALPTVLTDTPNVVCITFVAGYSVEDPYISVPFDLRNVVYKICSHYWYNREIGDEEKLNMAIESALGAHAIKNNWFWETL